MDFQLVKEEIQDMREARNKGGKGGRIKGLEVLVREETIGMRVLERVSRKDRRWY